MPSRNLKKIQRRLFCRFWHELWMITVVVRSWVSANCLFLLLCFIETMFCCRPNVLKAMLMQVEVVVEVVGICLKLCCSTCTWVILRVSPFYLKSLAWLSSSSLGLALLLYFCPLLLFNSHDCPCRYFWISIYQDCIKPRHWTCPWMRLMVLI